MSSKKADLDLGLFEPQWKGEIPQTPFYLYSEQILENLWDAFSKSIDSKQKDSIWPHYAMKANDNPKVMDFFKSKGAGIDLVSGWEWKLAKKAGFKGSDFVFSGVGKSQWELEQAIADDAGLINVESLFELEDIIAIAAKLGKKAQIAIRINPDVDAKTHPYISTGLHDHKFGVEISRAFELYMKAATHKEELICHGVSMHIGSQMMELKALEQAVRIATAFAKDLIKRGLPIKVLDLGGGLGVPYKSPADLPKFSSYGRILCQAAGNWTEIAGSGARVYCELGRALVAQAGVLYSKVIGIKQASKKDFCVIDASMSELLRPALYQATHPIWKQGSLPGQETDAVYSFVGPVCESSDVFAEGYGSQKLSKNDFVLIGVTGAYGRVMSSGYNARPLPQEYWHSSSGQVLNCTDSQG